MATFTNLILHETVKKIRETVASDPALLGFAIGADPSVSTERRERIVRVVRYSLPVDCPASFTADEIVAAWVAFRKKSNSDADGRADLEVELYRKYGAICFWNGRVSGECDDEVTIDRLLPGSRGGRYDMANCVLSCRYHNVRRGNLSVEEYLTQYPMFMDHQ